MARALASVGIFVLLTSIISTCAPMLFFPPRTCTSDVQIKSPSYKSVISFSTYRSTVIHSRRNSGFETYLQPYSAGPGIMVGVKTVLRVQIADKLNLTAYHYVLIRNTLLLHNRFGDYDGTYRHSVRASRSCS